MRSSVQTGTETQYVGLHQCYLPSMHQVVCIFAAPIPVGHRVECQWFAEQVQGVLSGARTVTWNHEPLIKDLDSGIEYSSHRAWQVMGGKASLEPLHIGNMPNPSVQATHRLVGVVRRCRVITALGYEGEPIQTHLDIDPQG